MRQRKLSVYFMAVLFICGCSGAVNAGAAELVGIKIKIGVEDTITDPCDYVYCPDN